MQRACGGKRQLPSVDFATLPYTKFGGGTAAVELRRSIRSGCTVLEGLPTYLWFRSSERDGAHAVRGKVYLFQHGQGERGKAIFRGIVHALQFFTPESILYSSMVTKM